MAATQEPAKVGELLKHIGEDVKIIAVNELELARAKLGTYLEQTVMKAAGMILGAFVALIGLAMLCVVVVVALEPVIAALWLRLLLMALLYIAVGGGATVLFAKKMGNKPDLEHEVDEVGQTIDKISRRPPALTEIDMRSTKEIQQELDTAQDSLERDIAQLKQVIEDKIEGPKHVVQAVENAVEAPISFVRDHGLWLGLGAAFAFGLLVGRAFPSR